MTIRGLGYTELYDLVVNVDGNQHVNETIQNNKTYSLTTNYNLDLQVLGSTELTDQVNGDVTHNVVIGNQNVSSIDGYMTWSQSVSLGATEDNWQMIMAETPAWTEKVYVSASCDSSSSYDMDLDFDVLDNTITQTLSPGDSTSGWGYRDSSNKDIRWRVGSSSGIHGNANLTYYIPYEAV